MPSKGLTIDDLSPVSAEQESLWFREVLTGLHGLFNVALSLRIRGPLDVSALIGALRTIVERHAPLRTTFVVIDGQPWQDIHPTAMLGERLVDTSTAADPAGHARALAAEEIAKPFDLQSERPLRVAVYRLGVADHVLVVTMHHIVSDAWSTGILVNELRDLYRTAVTGRRSRLAPLPVTYAEVVRRQRADLEGGRLSVLRAYWRTTLAGAPQTLSLPAEMPAKPRRTRLGGSVSVTVRSDVVQNVDRLAAGTRASAFMVLLAVYRVLLWQHTGQRDILIGAPMSGRRIPGTEQLIGYFLNMVVLRNRLTPTQSFRDLVLAERASTLSAFDHQDMPYGLLIDLLRPRRTLLSSTLIQTTCSYRPADDDQPDLAGLEVSYFPLGPAVSQFDLGLDLVRSPDGLRCLLGYNPDLYGASQMARLLQRLPVLLAGAVEDPTRRLRDLPVLTDGDRALLSAAGTGPTGVSDTTVVALFREQAAANPHGVALRQGRTVLTYGELDRLSEHLAARIRALAPEPADVVALLAERSPVVPLALLAAAKAGRTFAPLDPGHPPQRLSSMVADAGVSVLLTDQSEIPFDVPPGVSMVHLGPAILDAGAPGRPHAGTDPDPAQIAYLLYTSGSTGRPKGVTLAHRGLANCLADARARSGLRTGRRLVSITTPAFDMGILELLLPLVSGAELVIADAATAADGVALGALLDRYRPDCVHATPAAWQTLRYCGWQGDPDLLALSSGEALPPVLAEQLLGRTAGLWNLYGPTEATMYALAEPVHADPDRRSVPIGRPIPGTSIRVLDDAMRPVPPGVVGQLYLGGLGVALGYHNRPGLTADRFVPDPFATVPGSRLYATGDLVRLRDDGSMELLGRTDRQLKIRGFRVEPGEVETVLVAHDAVAEVSCIVTGSTGEEQQLVACLRLAHPLPDHTSTLRGHCQRFLPPYMVPARYLVLPELPRIPNGKIDRDALVELASDRVVGIASGRASESPAQRRVADIWAAVLGISQVPLDADFFDLGGNSLLAARVVGRVREHLGIDIAMSTLFDAPTVATFAAELESAPATGQRTARPHTADQGAP